MPVGFQKIHAINRKAFKFYRSKVFIPERTIKNIFKDMAMLEPYELVFVFREGKKKLSIY